MKSSELFLKAAYRLGISNIFGIVGGEADAIQFDEEENIDFYLTRHEFTAGIMADTYSRVTGNPQMCYSTFGPGLTNLSTGVFSAIQDRSPVLVVSAQVPREEICFNQTHQCIDNVSFMNIITKYSKEIEDVMEIPKILTEALNIAVNGIPGPVYISFPRDLMKVDIDEEKATKMLEALRPITRAEPPPLNYKTLDLVIKKIKTAKSPLIIVGNQVIRESSCNELLEFINMVNIPVMATLSSKGVIPENHPLFITSASKYIDRIHQQSNLTNKIFENCDLMLLIGYDFGEDAKASLWNGIESIVINSFYNDMGKAFQPNILCLGDLSKSLKYLSTANIQSKQMSNNITEVKHIFDNGIINDDGKSSALCTIIESLRNALGETGILCCDIGLHKLYVGSLSKTYLPNTFLCSTVCGSFGFGLPGGLGAKLAKPNEKVCVICGDGGLHSTSHDLETAVRYNIPIVIVVLNDNAFGMIKHCQFNSRDDIFPKSVELGKVDFVKLANANGMAAEYLNNVDGLEALLNKAFASNKPFLIEVPINYNYKI
ncbi:MAG: thiamine pyrophosphate-dependent enzyme possible carboligase or decarboxylase [Burkholderiales bacterium]|jgi:acetolactate synthase-1/2/3 large subunit/N2-(2-carboxyethyl)arginine synthase|nr:thiamine pyrophosphate-dependent enzyme possible carboligase or decarboxylase [Burkholderiales bacterium]